MRYLDSASDSDGVTTVVSAASAVVAAPLPAVVGSTAPASVGVLGGASTVLASTPVAAAPAAVPPGAGDRGAVNGSGGGEGASLHLSSPASLRRSFAAGAFVLRGVLRNAGGQPIAGARLDVLSELPLFGAAPSRIASATTQRDGSFVVALPPGPSRSVEVAYRAFSNDAGYAASASVQESVQAGVTLAVHPGQTSSHGTITLAGKVQGGYLPPAGKVVELKVDYRLLARLQDADERS